MSRVAARDATFLKGIAAAAAVAADAADDVDRHARFPNEALAALRECNALSALVPSSLGGGGVSLLEVAEACFELGRSCAATGMVYAMHQIQIGAIVGHSEGATAFESYLSEVCTRQLLIASATSEVGVGGDIRRSDAAVVADGSWVTLEKQATTISYGAQADDILVTARRSGDAEPGDQVLVLARGANTTLEQVGVWDVLGMRGTCSPGFVLRTRVPADHVLPIGFGDVAARTMVPLSHIFWSHVWLGIATCAYDRARSCVRGQARRPSGASGGGADRLPGLFALLQSMQSEVRSGAAAYAAVTADLCVEDAFTVGLALRLNTLKINASEMAPRVCEEALAVTGIAGYRNDTPYSMGRPLRDALSAALMIGNDRIRASNASLLLVHKG